MVEASYQPKNSSRFSWLARKLFKQFSIASETSVVNSSVLFTELRRLFEVMLRE